MWTKTQSNTRKQGSIELSFTHPKRGGGNVGLVAKKMTQEKKRAREGKRQEAGGGILGSEGEGEKEEYRKKGGKEKIKRKGRKEGKVKVKM